MIPTPSRQATKVLSEAVKRASRLGFGRIGTENLLISLANSRGPGRKLDVQSLLPQAMARGTTHWFGDDGGVAEPGRDVMALIHTAHHHAGVETLLPVSGALDRCLSTALAEAGDDVLTTTHLALALLSLDSALSAELMTLRYVDAEATARAVRAACEPEESPAMWLMHKTGALEGETGGGYVNWLTKLIVRGRGLGSPVLTIVRHEAERHAVAAGREDPTARDLVAAVLSIDHQLAKAGKRLKPEFASRGAEILRDAGVDVAALPVVSTGADVDRAIEGAKLTAVRRGDEVVGTEHLLLALRDDPFDPLRGALAGLGAET
ncbi:Clp amino terminal domain-containing protein, pathogenicity island component [Lentzea fradiae]|uniref:Clp amino terminal domain-containing protein, pathogenicity island component n=1 Tax=Lentzea fradiae TaxID=200378 RepID=A0A1G7UAV8_9PSEU|nr:Clp protease N-terminal domain-containing protein [Lentzea fradiae]SDG44725.1 Clp amino terminal domain-containing protein, pathogenicity island component [Lentzea fradiae]